MYTGFTFPVQAALTSFFVSRSNISTFWTDGRMETAPLHSYALNKRWGTEPQHLSDCQWLGEAAVKHLPPSIPQVCLSVCQMPPCLSSTRPGGLPAGTVAFKEEFLHLDIWKQHQEYFVLTSAYLSLIRHLHPRSWPWCSPSAILACRRTRSKLVASMSYTAIPWCEQQPNCVYKNL